MISVRRTALAFLLSASLLLSGPLPTPAQPATPEASQGATYWYSNGVKQPLRRAAEVAVVLEAPSAKTSARVARAARLVGGSCEVAGDEGLVLVEGIERTSLRGKLFATYLGTSSNVRSQSSVYYRGSDPDATRMVLSGEVLLHTKQGRGGDALIRARELGLTLKRKLAWSKDTYVLASENADDGLEAANRLQESGLVLYAYPNWLGGKERSAIPNDTYFGDQWHLNNTGQGGGIAGNSINVLSAWDSVRGNGKHIAVVDDSLERGHVDLAPNMASAGHWDYVSNDSNPDPARSDDRHGTAVAGIAAGRGFNGAGITGVAPAATLLGRRIAFGSSYDDVKTADALALNAASVDVVNCSFGSSSPELDPNTPAIDNALAYGTSSGRGGKGTVYVVASGNGGKDLDNANYSGFANSRRVIAVSASDANGDELSYSEPGACVLVNAPSGPPGKDNNGDPCVAKATAAVEPQGQSLLRSLYRFRDGFLAESETGRALAAEYYRFTGSVALATVFDGDLRAAIRAAVPHWLPLVESLSGDGSRVITADDVKAFYDLVAELKQLENKPLRTGLDQELEYARPEEFIGKTVGELWQAFERARTGTSPAAVGPATAQAELPLIPTTDRTGSDGYNPETTNNNYPDYTDQSYTKYFNGTSASAPIVSGVVALMLEANPNLGWRDVSKILATTAAKNDPTDGDWQTNGAGHHINHRYGFGRVDAAAAVSAARTATLLGPESAIEKTAWPNLPIPDNNATGVTDSISVTEELSVERAEVMFTAGNHTDYGDLKIELISPSGTKSILAEKHDAKDSVRYLGWRFTSVRHLGEAARGTWKLKVSDLASGDTGTLQSWSLKLYGTAAGGGGGGGTQPPMPAAKRAIYVLPGYLGSRLYDKQSNGSEVWAEPGRIQKQILVSGDTLALNASGEGQKAWVDRSKDAYGTQDFYKNLVDTLKAKVNAQGQAKYVEVKFFPWDWRQDINKATNLLAADVSAGGYTQVALIGHSTGGLLAADFAGQYPHMVDKVVTLATPLLGTFPSMRALLTGEDPTLDDAIREKAPGIVEPIFLGVAHNWVKRMLRNTPCSYQLLPSSEYLAANPMNVQGGLWPFDWKGSISGADSMHDNFKRSNVDLNDNMLAGTAAGHNKFRNDDIGPDITKTLGGVPSLVLGSEGAANTITGADFWEDFVDRSVYLEKFSTSENKGDGTVPAYSALAGHTKSETVGLSNFVLYPKSLALDHGDMAQDRSVIQEVIAYLWTGTVPSPTSYGSQATGPRIAQAGTGRAMVKFEALGAAKARIFVDVLRASDNAIVARISDTQRSGWDDSEFAYSYLDADLTRLQVWLPASGYKIRLTPSSQTSPGAGDSVRTTVATIDVDGKYTATGSFAALSASKTILIDLRSLAASNIGSTPIVVTAAGGGTSSATLEVRTNYSTGVSLTSSVSTLAKGTSSTFAGRSLPGGEALHWSSSDPSVVTIDGAGGATAANYGTAFVVATSVDGNHSESVKVVVPLKPDSMKLTCSRPTLAVGERWPLTVSFLPESATTPAITYASDNQNVASVSSAGVVTAVGVGTARITAAGGDGLSSSVSVSVRRAATAPTKVVVTAPKARRGGARLYDLSGTIKPTHRTTRAVRIYIEQRVGRRWVKRGALWASASGQTYKARYRFSKVGTWRIRAFHAADTAGAAAWSGWSTVKAK